MSKCGTYAVMGAALGAAAMWVGYKYLPSWMQNPFAARRVVTPTARIMRTPVTRTTTNTTSIAEFPRGPALVVD